jgi:hypothetical protein
MRVGPLVLGGDGELRVSVMVTPLEWSFRRLPWKVGRLAVSAD